MSWPLGNNKDSVLAIYSGEMPAWWPNPTTIEPPGGYLARDTGRRETLTATTSFVPAGQYIVYFYAEDRNGDDDDGGGNGNQGHTATTGQITAVRGGC